MRSSSSNSSISTAPSPGELGVHMDEEWPQLGLDKQVSLWLLRAIGPTYLTNGVVINCGTDPPEQLGSVSHFVPCRGTRSTRALTPKVNFRSRSSAR
jgi:hypothetical protein